MDVLRISESNWLPDELIQGYESFVWTERYLGSGEFELKTLKVDETRALLPKGSKIGVRGNQEVMTVETNSIENTDKGPELTVTGRTFEKTIFENRCTVIVNPGPGQNNMWTYEDDEVWPTEAARALIMSHVTVCPEADAQRVHGVSVANLIQNHPGDKMSYKHEPGPLDEEITRLLDMENAGIRNQLDLDVNGGLKIYIYRGVNRTVNQSSRDAVVFSVSADHVANPKYIFTVRDYKNVAYVVGKAWQQRVYAPGTSSNVSGEDRRILFVNADQIEAKDSDAKKERQARALGLSALAKHNRTSYFDGEASPGSPYRRGVHYNLGDRVTLMGKYDMNQTMIVSEYVSTEDETGERGFPTLVTPSELEGDG
jgi:hypothetical protein